MITTDPTCTGDRLLQTLANALSDELEAEAVLLVVLRDRDDYSGAAISATPEGARLLAHTLRKRADEIIARLEEQSAASQLDKLSQRPRDGHHHRRCWECGHVAEYSSGVAPECLCRQCGSQDTRRVREEVTA